jgi:hypothetical protein
LVQGEQLDYRPADLERVVLGNAEANPQMRLMLVTSHPTEDTVTLPVTVDDGGGVGPADAGAAHGTVSYGPSAQGGLVMLRIDPEHARRGRSAAPTAAAAAALADDVWDLGIGPLVPATQVR